MADYALEGPKWGAAGYGTAGGTVTWAVASSVPASFVAIIGAAFADWSTKANIQFQQVASTATGQIDFSVAPIDGLDNVLGETRYAYFANIFSSAAIEFDSGEGWTPANGKVVSADGADLFIVALHEIGHALGLDHYNTTSAVMNAYLDPRVTDLTTSDIDGIQAIYGAASSAGTGSVPTPTPIPAPTPAPTSPGTTSSGSADGASAIYRFYDQVTGDHFYTRSKAEKLSIQASHTALVYEGTPWAAPTKGTDTVDVYRFFDTVTQTHFFTTDTAERNSILGNLPTFTYEGVGFQAYAAAGGGDTLTLERFYNTDSHMHHFATPDEAARMRLGASGANWLDEGRGFTVHAPV